MKFIAFIFCSLLMCSCVEDHTQKYVGTWSNTYLGGGADIEIVVRNDGGNLYVEQRLASSHSVIARATAKVENGYLVVGPSLIFTKATYSKDENALIFLEGPMNGLAPFKKTE